MSDKPLLKFFIDEMKDSKITNASCEMRWCIEPKLLDIIEKQRLLHPHLIISVINPRSGEVSRQFVPLDQGSTFVTFDRGGENTVHAILVHGQHPHKFKAEYKKRYHRGIDLYDYSYDDDFEGFAVRDDIFNKENRHSFCKGLIKTNATITVNVDEELFAKEPNETVLFFTNLWYETNLRDQCHFRQRFIITLFLKSWPILIWSLIQFIGRAGWAAILWGVGFRDVGWKAIVKPWSLPFQTVHFNIELDNNYLLRGDKSGDNFNDYTWWLWPAAPIGWCVFGIPAALIYSFATGTGLFTAYWTMMALAVVVLAAIVAIICVIVVIVALCNILAENDAADKAIHYLSLPILWPVQKLIDHRNRDLTPEEIERIRAQQRLPQMACPQESSKPYISPAPVSLKQRFVLWFQRTKAKVCKPFPV